MASTSTSTRIPRGLLDPFDIAVTQAVVFPRTMEDQASVDYAYFLAGHLQRAGMTPSAVVDRRLLYTQFSTRDWLPATWPPSFDMVGGHDIGASVYYRDDSMTERVKAALNEVRSIFQPRTVLLAAPRSFCAGVERAIGTVEAALAEFGAPVYVRKQIVHNQSVLAALEARGAVFVDDLDDVPEGSAVVFSAHGVAPTVRQQARDRQLRAVDATCPLVAKVHAEVRRAADARKLIVLVGDAAHEEVVGTTGEAPRNVRVVRSADDVARIPIAAGARGVRLVTQTTLSLEEVADATEHVRKRFPTTEVSPKSDVCYAATNRQAAVRAIASDVDCLLVFGSANSANANHLVEISISMGTPSHLVESMTDVYPEWLRGVGRIGISAGASTPSEIVDSAVGALQCLGPVSIEHRVVTTESVHFDLPRFNRR